jgi:KTSC domain
MAVKSSPLNSSWMSACIYDDEQQALTIKMGGKSFTFSSPPVPEDIYQGLVAAPSAGQFYHDNIKGVYS